MVENTADEFHGLSGFFNISIIQNKTGYPGRVVAPGFCLRYKLFGKCHQQFAPIHPRIVHQAVKGIVINIFKKVFASDLHPANTFTPEPENQ